MRFRFIGQYTGGRTSITLNGVTFEGREPSEVPAEAVARFSRHIEFEMVEAPKRGRPRKVVP